MSDLRDRITKAISDAQFAFDQGDPYNGPEDAEVLADAVIRELNLQPETLYRPGQHFVVQPGRNRTADNRYMTRWATPWEADESPEELS